MRNHEVTTKQMLLDQEGEIAEPGWAREQVWTYRRDMIKASKLRIKEWDYYVVQAKDFAVAFTVSDEAYVGLQSVSLLKLKEEHPWEHTETVLNAFPMGRLHLPESSSKGDVIYKSRRLKISFLLENGTRHIVCNFKKFHEKKDFSCDIVLKQPEMDSMVIATPWDKEHAFYYNQKINCMRASGFVKFGDELFEFHPETDFGTLDWGRGVWTYDNTWYWGSMNCDLNGKAFGFNIGCGFGNTSKASENVLFYDGKVHKLDDVTFHYDCYDYYLPWEITSSDERFEMHFVPVLDRCADMDFKIISSEQHQVFGRISGKAVLDDGTVIELKDVMCFIEQVRNRY